jgi:hypothetical protein
MSMGDKEFEARLYLEDVKRRAALWEFFWKAAHADEIEKGRPIPNIPPDEFVRRELKRIIKG